jgi:hypothetical protein
MATNREKALAKFLDIKVSDIEEASYGENAYDAGGLGEYLVLTGTEADAAAEEAIEDSLFAFNPEWLAGWLEIPVEAIKAIQESMYEDASPVFKKMLGEDFVNFVEKSIEADGRGHFISHYDGEENEEYIGKTYYFIYRTN